MDPKKDESLANLDLIWPRARWGPVLSHVVTTAGAHNSPAERSLGAFLQRDELTQEQALGEFIDAVSLVELACLSGWAKPQDFPNGLLILAASLLSGSQSPSWVVQRTRDVLPILFLFRLKADLLVSVGLAEEEPIANSTEHDLRTFDTLIEDLRSTLFDPSIRSAFDVLSRRDRVTWGSAADALLSSRSFVLDLFSNSAPEPVRQDASSPASVVLSGLWRFVCFAGRFGEGMAALSDESSATEVILRSAYWHLFSRWFEQARLHRHLLCAIAESVRGVLNASPGHNSRTTSAKERTPNLRLVSEEDGETLAQADAGIALIDNGGGLYRAPAADYLEAIKAKCAWL